MMISAGVGKRQKTMMTSAGILQAKQGASGSGCQMATPVLVRRSGLSDEPDIRALGRQDSLNGFHEFARKVNDALLYHFYRYRAGARSVGCTRGTG
jgi:hypothetical protein